MSGLLNLDYSDMNLFRVYNYIIALENMIKTTPDIYPLDIRGCFYFFLYNNP